MGIPEGRLTCLAAFVTQKQNKAKQNKEGKNKAFLAGGEMCHWVKILQLANTVAEKVNYIQGDVRVWLGQREGMEQRFGHGSQCSLGREVLSLHAQPGHVSCPEGPSLWRVGMEAGIPLWTQTQSRCICLET